MQINGRRQDQTPTNASVSIVNRDKTAIAKEVVLSILYKLMCTHSRMTKSAKQKINMVLSVSAKTCFQSGSKLGDSVHARLVEDLEAVVLQHLQQSVQFFLVGFVA